MPKSTESINQDLEDLLASRGYDVTALDSAGKEVPVASEADVFQFHFHRNGKDYGTVTISIDGLQKLTVYYDDEISSSGSGEGDDDTGNNTTWISLVKQLKKFSLQHQLGFVLKDTDRLRTDMKRRTHTKKLEEGAELKKIKREYNVAAKNKGGDFEGAGKKIDNMKKGLRQRDIGKDKSVAEGSDKVITGTNNAGNEIFWVEMDHKNPARSMDGIGRPDNGTEGRSVGYVIRDDQGRWREMASDIGRVPYEYGNQSHPEKLTADQVFMRIKERLSRGGTQIRSIAGYPPKQTKLDEGYYGNRKMSYSDDTPQVKMVIKHNRQLEETDKRFRNIEKIFLETNDGERFSVPTNKPSRARAFARHIAEGGAYRDERWTHIAEMCEDLDKLGGFVRATTGKKEQFNESAQRMISEAADQYQNLRETLKRVSSNRGYNKYFESYQPTVITENEEDLLETFSQSTVDSRIENALPTLAKFGIRRGQLDEADMFEQWANGIIDESLDIDNTRQIEELTELLLEPLSMGPNGEVAIGELQDIIEDDELYERLRRAASSNPNNDARPQIIAWMQEQDTADYRRVLDKIEIANNEEDNQPAAPQETPAEPSEPDSKKSDGKDSPQPDLKESDDLLDSFKRLLGK